MRIFLPVLLSIGLGLSLAGCGKAGRPQQPPGSQYPLIYPNPAATPYGIPGKDATKQQVTPEAAKGKFTANGAYIDPSTEVNPNGAGIAPNSNLPNTRQETNDLFSQGLGSPSQSPLRPVVPSDMDTSPDEEQQQ